MQSQRHATLAFMSAVFGDSRNPFLLGVVWRAPAFTAATHELVSLSPSSRKEQLALRAALEARKQELEARLARLMSTVKGTSSQACTTSHSAKTKLSLRHDAQGSVADEFGGTGTNARSFSPKIARGETPRHESPAPRLAKHLPISAQRPLSNRPAAADSEHETFCAWPGWKFAASGMRKNCSSESLSGLSTAFQSESSLVC